MNLYHCSACGAEAIVRETKPQVMMPCCKGTELVAQKRGPNPNKKKVVFKPEEANVVSIVPQGIVQGLNPGTGPANILEMTVEALNAKVAELQDTNDALVAKCMEFQSKLAAAEERLKPAEETAKPVKGGVQLDVAGGAIPASVAPQSVKVTPEVKK